MNSILVLLPVFTECSTGVFLVGVSGGESRLPVRQGFTLLAENLPRVGLGRGAGRKGRVAGHVRDTSFPTRAAHRGLPADIHASRRAARGSRRDGGLRPTGLV